MNDAHRARPLDSTKRRNHLRILFADDDATLQRNVKRVAESRGDALVQVTTGARVVERALEAQPDVIVLDIEFPDADGRDVLAELKRDQRTAHIPVVVWSGQRQDPESDSRIAITLGAEDYVEKSNAELLFCKLDRVLLRLSA
jgi:CheY-like chemotaxis protein